MAYSNVLDGWAVRSASCKLASSGFSPACLTRRTLRFKGIAALAKARRFTSDHDPNETNGPAPKDSKRQRRRAFRSKSPAIGVRRGDLRYARPPWQLEKTATFEQLELNKYIYSMHEDVPSDSVVFVQLSVDRAGSGYYVRATVNADVKLECSTCCDPVTISLKSDFQVYLNCRPRDCRESEDPYEVIFPQNQGEADLSSFVVGSLMAALPATRYCASPTCTTGGSMTSRDSAQASRRWSTQDWSAPSAASSPFHKLVQLKGKLSG